MVGDLRRTLEAKQFEIATLIADLAGALDSAGNEANRSRSDRYGLSSNRHSQVAALQELHHQAAGIDRALAKLDSGTYGLCDSCGAIIPRARLENYPWATLCVPCAAGVK